MGPPCWYLPHGKIFTGRSGRFLQVIRLAKKHFALDEDIEVIQEDALNFLKEARAAYRFGANHHPLINPWNSYSTGADHLGILIKKWITDLL